METKVLFEFGEFRLDPAEHLLLRDRKPVSLTPKAFDILQILLQSNGRLLSKEDLMSRIWPNSFVEEANLTVNISALRRVLGDRPDGGEYIETVPKRGYRFIAEVTKFLEEGEAARPQVRTVLRPQQQPAESVKAWERPVQVASALPTPAVPARASRRSRKVAAAFLVVIVVLAIAGIAALLYRQHMTRSPAPASRRLAILPFQNLRQDPDSDFLSYSLADAVITKLGYLSALSVRPSATIQKYRNQVIDIHKVATELNVDTLLSASFIREGDDLRITYQLIDAKTEKIIGKGAIDLKYEKLLKVQDSVSQEIIGALALNLSPSETERLRTDVPVNAVAYEYYLRGVDLYGRHNFPLAINMLERSVEIDPNYALTWAYLGASYTSHATFELGGREQYRKAQTAYERALRIQPTQLEAHIFLANLLIDNGKVEQAVPLLRDALRTNPNRADVHWELGYAYRFAGMLQESVAECELARQLDPSVIANGAVLNTYLYLGQYDRFLRSLPDDNDHAFVLFYRGFGEYHLKQWQRAARDFDRADDLDPSLYTQIGKALSASVAHRDSDGLSILTALEKKIADRGVGDAEATYKIAQAYAALGDHSSALRALRNSIENGFFAYPYFMTDPLMESVRNTTEFADLVKGANRRHEAFKSKFF
jgi:DNA-binding winged helix-turn-helix (wHTH) protein/TolB-like protein/cytochrome c-type biogenesis protein CcmH/NrfG